MVDFCALSWPNRVVGWTRSTCLAISSGTLYDRVRSLGVSSPSYLYQANVVLRSSLAVLALVDMEIQSLSIECLMPYWRTQAVTPESDLAEGAVYERSSSRDMCMP